MKYNMIQRLALALLVAVFSMQGSAMAEPAKPFADKRVVLQMSDADAQKHTLVLNVASNLVKHYGPDRVDVELVAFGPGLKLLLANSENADRIQSLADNGVRFRACSNTYRKMTRKLGREPVLNAAVKRVPAGIVEILDRVDEGYTLVRP